LRRIIQNFLSNAIYYGPTTQSEQARVTLGVKHQNGALQIQVWDNGSGIPEDKQQLIFNEFERLESGRDKPGLGLGLTISDRIAKLLDCTIAMKSKVNLGSMFALNIEKSTKRKVSSSTEEQNTKTNKDLNGLSFILIDNDELLLTALTKQLESWGCKVTAISGRPQWQQFERELQLKQETFDFIIADYHLDDGDNGVDLVNAIFAESNTLTPCIICSADPSEPLRQHCSDAGFSFMKKPVKGLALKRLIKQLL